MKKVNEYIKRIGVMGLTAAMLVSQFPTTALAAQGVPEKTIEIKGFDGLPDDVKAQKLPVGSSESDIKLPDTLTVTIIKPQSEEIVGKETKKLNSICLYEWDDED